nr:unnamed protein product [Callosobruchus analis]
MEGRKSTSQIFNNCSNMNYGLTRRSALSFTHEFATINKKHIPKSWFTTDSMNYCEKPGIELENHEGYESIEINRFSQKKY